MFIDCLCMSVRDIVLPHHMQEQEQNLNTSFHMLSLLPTRKEDSGTQRIRLSAEIVDGYKIAYGSCVRMSTPDLVVIGTIHHCHPSLAFNGIHIDPTVTENQSIHSIIKRADLKQRITLQLLECKHAEQLEVKLVVVNKSQYWDSHVAAELGRKCFHCIYNKVVTPGCKVELSQSRLGRLLGMCVCIVLSCGDDEEANDTAAFRITEKTVIKVIDIESWEHYNVMQRQISKYRVCMGGVEREMKLLTDLLWMPRKHQEMFDTLSIPKSSGVLLRGPPGCGKTSLVYKLAHECHAALVAISGPEIIGSYPGESEANLKKVFEKAVRLSREGPCILFIDEIDSICQRSLKSNSSNSTRLTGALLAELDCVAQECGLLVVAATNRPSALDPAVRCQGRLEEEVSVLKEGACCLFVK